MINIDGYRLANEVKNALPYNQQWNDNTSPQSEFVRALGNALNNQLNDGQGMDHDFRRRIDHVEGVLNALCKDVENVGKALTGDDRSGHFEALMSQHSSQMQRSLEKYVEDLKGTKDALIIGFDKILEENRQQMQIEMQNKIAQLKQEFMKELSQI